MPYGTRRTTRRFSPWATRPRPYAREQGAASGVYIDESLVTFQWQCADEKGGTYADIEKATSSELAIDASLQGKYLRCVVKANVGSSSYNATVNLPVAAAGSINVTSVKLGASGKVNVGTTLTATATAAQGDVTDSEKVTWAWYCGSTSASADTKIEEAQGNTLTLTQELVDKYGLLGKYIEARADGGFGEEDSAAVGPVVVPGMVELSSVSLRARRKWVARSRQARRRKRAPNSSAAVADTDVVYCQWMYADTRSTDPSAYTEIPGATGKTYTVQEEYLRRHVASGQVPLPCAPPARTPNTACRLATMAVTVPFIRWVPSRWKGSTRCPA